MTKTPREPFSEECVECGKVTNEQMQTVFTAKTRKVYHRSCLPEKHWLETHLPAEHPLLSGTDDGVA